MRWALFPLFVFGLLIVASTTWHYSGVPVAAVAVYTRALGQSAGLDNQRFTLVILSHNRLPLLRYNLQLICAPGAIRSLAHVIIVWPLTTEQGPPPGDFINPNWTVPVEFVATPDRGLSDRFLPLAEIQTRGIMILDDDLTIMPQDIEFAFHVWREHSSQIVGFSPRIHRHDVQSNRHSYDHILSTEYSIVLTNIAFVHIAVLHAYWARELEPLRAYVNQKKNCEDLLINFVSARVTGKPPLLVRGLAGNMVHWSKAGLSTHPGHISSRSECLNEFFKHFGPEGLLTNNMTMQQWVYPITIDQRYGTLL